MWVRLFSLGAALLCLVSCRTETQAFDSTERLRLSDGAWLTLTRTDYATRSVGLITGTDYGTRRSYRYALAVRPGGAAWTGDRGEHPRTLVQCPEALWLETQAWRVAEPDSLTGAWDMERLAVTAHYRHVDDRYLFGLLGEQWWEDVDLRRSSRPPFPRAPVPRLPKRPLPLTSPSP